MKVVIIGGVAGGATTATRLRRLNEDAKIIMLERGEYVSFANCGLPYYIGNEIKEKEKLLLQKPSDFKERYNIDVRVLNEAIEIDKENKIVRIKNLQTGEIYDESYDKLVLSPGATPIKPNIEGIDNKRVFTLRNIPDTYKIKEFIDEFKPKSAAVVGGGYIGIEMAENLINLGISVTIIEQSKQIINSLDMDMSSYVKRYIESKGAKILLSNAVKKIEEKKDRLKITTDNKEIEVDMVIMSAGVKPETSLAKDANLELNGFGAIKVNEKMQTSDHDIYALGDAVEITNFVTKKKGYIPLAGPANKQARVVANNICGRDSTYKGTQGSSILKVFDITVASTGINEFLAKEANIDYDKIIIHPYSHATYYPNAFPLIIKVIYENKTGRILGSQVIGRKGADKRCDVFAVAIRANMTASDLIELELCYAPPYSSAKDPVNIAGSVIENIILHDIKNVHFQEVKDNILNDDYLFLDVREEKEMKRVGYLPGSLNIPIDELRGRIDEIDKTKRIIAICQSGLRSYLACQILNKKGFKTYNLSGGFDTYSSIDRI